MKNVFSILLLAIIVIVPSIIGVFGDLYWFSSLGLESVFFTIFLTSLALGLAGGLGFLLFALLNLKVAVRKKKIPKPLLGLALVFSGVIGLGLSRQWETVLKYLNASSFPGTDPVFGLNIGFFVFEYPFMGVVTSYLGGVVILTLVLVLGAQVIRHQSKPRGDLVDEISLPAFIEWKALKKEALPQLSFLLGLGFLILAYVFQIAQWGLLFSPLGTIFGPGYTDLSITLPLFSILSVIAGVVGILMFANVRFRRWRLPIEGIAAFMVILILGLAIAGVTQAVVVAPDEFNLERPFIERNIEFTSLAYGIDQIKETPFPVSYDLTKEDILANEGTIRNIRLWDFRPLIETYTQLQLFRTYYTFNDVDIDRYNFDGVQRQVMISARELDVDALPSQAQTWVNRHLVYTHGYGLVMNPVDEVTSEGLPVLLVQDIPPKGVLPTTQNEIYFGESDLEYVIVGTTTEELDFPEGNTNSYTSYAGQDGIPLDGVTRLLYALRFGSVEILFSNSIQPDSKLLINRNIMDRVQEIAPFLGYDSDPYLVLSEGRMFWVLDAYTTSSLYPYSQPFEIGFLQDINYVRNAVKVVIDAYNGDVQFYVIDPDDPIIQTYQAIFPELFTPFEEMSSDLKEHIRYPEGLFRIQAEIYATYHMKDVRVFYNREDVWVRPEEIYRGNRQELIPYYVIMKLPGEAKEEFVLMQPFVPRGKDNMIGWMAARSDAPNYGDLIVFRFTKQSLVYGPLQIEARIDQNTDISALFTLWSQSGSRVIRGNTLVIPIEDSILYIEPVFLEATEKGTLPQLQRVIVAFGDRLTMQPTLQEALDVIFGASPTTPRVPGQEPAATPSGVLKQVADLYDDAQAALRAGNLQQYANLIDQMGQLLQGI